VITLTSGAPSCLWEAPFRPLPAALAGVLVELEQLPAVAKVLQGDAKTAKRFRQATGAAVRIIMEGRGWRKTGKKGAVGVGKHFTRAERYVRAGGNP
jgi:hypothetical protein